MSDILKLNDSAFLKLKRQFENRLNKLFVHPLMGDLLDSGEIDFAVMQILEEFLKVHKKGNILSGENIYVKNDLMQMPLFKALFDLNIIWKSKYYETFQIEHFMYVAVIEDWLERRKQAMNRYEKLLFWLYKKKHARVKLSKRYHGVGPPSARSMTKRGANKADYRWDFANLYYEGV